MAGKSKSKFDFGGFATKVGIKCDDGRTIMPNAFKHQDGATVPLVWQHQHDAPGNVLGHAVLENRPDGVYAYCAFNNNPKAQEAKELVAHGDIASLSIHARKLKQQGLQVLHGVIHEVSLVMAGANSGAMIDNLCFSHADGADGFIEDPTEANIYMDLPLDTDIAIQHSSEEEAPKHAITLNSEQLKHFSSMLQELEPSSELAHADLDDGETVQAIFDSLDEKEKTVVYAIVAKAVEAASTVQHSIKEGDEDMKVNIFDVESKPAEDQTLTHADCTAIVKEAEKTRANSLKEVFLAHAASYGIENIEVLFPEAQKIRNTPDMIKREDEWVSGFLGACYKTPFSRIKSTSVDITADEARAKGYITGKRKKEEVIPILKRTTTPTTIYKKQKLDRDDIVDITDFDVVVWLKGEMQMMLKEELARACLIGDGRPVESEDKINEQNIRPIWTDDDLFCHKWTVATDTTTIDLIDEVVRARKTYKGSGVPNFYTTSDIVTDMLLVRDSVQRRLYPTLNDLASAMHVKEIISVDVMEEQTRTLSDGTGSVELIGIMVNPKDYTIGANKGGEVTLFDDFDIDYNQYKYLMETRCSGALTKPKSAVALERAIQG